MRWVLGFIACLLVIAILTITVITVCWRYMQRVARRVGLLDHQPSRKPIKGNLWLLDRDMEKYLNERKREGSE